MLIISPTIRLHIFDCFLYNRRRDKPAHSLQCRRELLCVNHFKSSYSFMPDKPEIENGPTRKEWQAERPRSM
jgi:hypothetical protein